MKVFKIIWAVLITVFNIIFIYLIFTGNTDIAGANELRNNYGNVAGATVTTVGVLIVSLIINAIILVSIKIK